MGLIAAWLVGLMLDIALADPLGLNAILLATVTYVAWRFCERLRMYTLPQQCAVVFLLLAGCDVLRVVVQDLAWDRGYSTLMIMPALISTALWPVLSAVLERLRLGLRGGLSAPAEPPALVLASASPRRRQLLGELGLAFRCGTE